MTGVFTSSVPLAFPVPMPADPLPPADDADSMTADEFNHRIGTDPAFAAQVRADLEQAQELAPSPEREEQLANFDRHIARMRVREKLLTTRTLFRSVVLEQKLEHLPALSALLDELVDDLLDLAEPERTAAMEKVLSIQASVRKLKTAADAVRDAGQ